MKSSICLAISAALLGATTLAAAARPAIALVGDRTLVMFDTESRTVSGMIDVEGVERLAGLDLRPGNATLVGVTSDNVIVTIDPASGVATELSRMSIPLEMGDAPVIVDFNPAADRLRYMTGTTNHRVNVDTGEVTVDGGLAYTPGDAGAGNGPSIVAAAYTNSFGKPESTAMFDIDDRAGTLVRQTSPNDGTLDTVGELGIGMPGAAFAFDIATAADGANSAYLVTGNMLYAVDLETGAASEIGPIEGVDGEIRDFTVLTAM